MEDYSLSPDPRNNPLSVSNVSDDNINENCTLKLTPMGAPKFPGLVHFATVWSHYHGYVCVVVCIFGIAANLANIVVLRRKNMISSTNTILLWLAVADLLTMSSYFPTAIHFYILRHPGLEFPSTLSYAWSVFFMFHINFTVLCHTIAIWLTIALAIFRFLYICYPIRGSVLCSLERAKLTVVIIIISTILVCVPNNLSNDIIIMKNELAPLLVRNYSNASMEPSIETISTQMGENICVRRFLKFYTISAWEWAVPHIVKINSWIQAFVIKLIPCVLLTMLTILLIIAMHRARQRSLKLKSAGKKDELKRSHEHNRTTGMLLAIVVLFLITEMPQGVLTLCGVIDPSVYTDVYFPLGDIFDLMALMNNAINFVLYCTMSRQFRRAFIDVFLGCCPKQRPGWMKIKTVTNNGNTKTTSCV